MNNELKEYRKTKKDLKITEELYEKKTKKVINYIQKQIDKYFIEHPSEEDDWYSVVDDDEYGVHTVTPYLPHELLSVWIEQGFKINIYYHRDYPGVIISFE